MKDIKKILKWTKKNLLAEFRIKGDKPKLYKHKRNLVDLSELIKELKDFDYCIQVGTDLAVYKGERPLVARLYATRRKYEKS
jgi:Fe-S-cluster formation regulator IscX/YfhJ